MGVENPRMGNKITPDEYRTLVGLPPASETPRKITVEEYRSMAADEAKAKRRNKYNARKTLLDGIIFDSGDEATRYWQLRLLEREGFVTDLELQPEFLIQEGFRDADGQWNLPIRYRADFRYREVRTGKMVVEDVKGVLTREFRRNWKFMKQLYPQYVWRIVKM
ncbi:MAG: hypothetical protein AMXMBFR84_26170 [Candidatus Hydrogenedentota bacterium]